MTEAPFHAASYWQVMHFAALGYQSCARTASELSPASDQSICKELLAVGRDLSSPPAGALCPLYSSARICTCSSLYSLRSLL